jgi:hypothetical protein
MRRSISGGNADQALDRPGRGVAERADGVAFDLLGDVQQHVDLALVGAALRPCAHHAPHPAGAFAARRALAAALVLVEIGDARDRLDMSVDLSITITAAVPRPEPACAAAVEIHRRIDDLLGRHHRHRRAAGDHRLQIVPAAAHAAGNALDQLAERNAHRLFDVAGLVHMAGDAEQLGAGVVRAGRCRRTRRRRGAGCRHHRDRFDVVDRGRAAIEADIGRERRLQPRLALLAFEAFEQRGLLAADIGAGAVMDVEVERPSRAEVLADQLGAS